MKDEIRVQWDCPHCGTMNSDDFANTNFPLCEGCDRSFWWDDLLTGQQMENCNRLLDAQNPDLLVNQIKDLVDSGTV